MDQDKILPHGNVGLNNQRANKGARCWLNLFLLILFVGALSLFAWQSVTKDWFSLDDIAIRLQSLGALAPIVYVLLRVVAVMVMLPSLPLDAAGGAIFGPFFGSIYSIIGALGGALTSFIIAQFLGREAIARWLKKDIAFCDTCTERKLVFVIFFARLLPMVSFDLVSYGAGLTRIPLRSFALATFFGMAPLTFAVSYFGGVIFSSYGYALLLGAILVLLFFVIPIWTKRHNPWGLYDRVMQASRSK